MRVRMAGNMNYRRGGPALELERDDSEIERRRYQVLGLLLKPGTGRDKRGISRPVPPTKTRDGIEFYCKRIRRKQRKGSRLLEHGTELLGVTTSAAAGQVCCW